MYISQLKKKSLLFSLLSHTLIIFLKGANTLLSSFYFLLHVQLSFLAIFFSLSGSLLAALLFLFSFFFSSSSSCAAILVATLTFALCAAILFLYSSICSTHKNLIYILSLYITQPSYTPSSTRILIHLNLETMLLPTSHIIIIQAHMWALTS